MKKVDYIVVGQGLSGSCFALELIRNKKSFVVIDNGFEFSSSRVAVGIFNPVVLKRFNAVWEAQKQLVQLLQTFREFELLLSKTYLHFNEVYRIFHDLGEVKTWQKKIDESKELSAFLEKEVSDYQNYQLDAPFGYGKVKASGRLNVAGLIQDFREYLKKENLVLEEKIDYNKIEFKEKSVSYQGIEAQKIVFAEGFGVKENPFFKDLPIDGSKGEVLEINPKGYLENSIIKSSVFLSPNSSGNYTVGATYDREDKSYDTTDARKEELVNKFEKFYLGDYSILSHKASIRPTVVDRRPILGQHPDKQNLVILNGMGTRGVMNAPMMAKLLFNHLETHHALPKEVDVKRFLSV